MINLHASGRMADILITLPVPVVVSETVSSGELISLQTLDALSSSPAGHFQTIVDRGLVIIEDFETEEEKANFLNHVAVLGDDGEAATLAIAAARGYAVATDDRKALRFAAQELPNIQLLHTPDLVKYWVDSGNPTVEDQRKALQKIRQYGRYIPPKTHRLYDWWMQLAE